MESVEKLEGFEGEVRVVIPPLIIKENTKDRQFNSFYLTDIGYYPKAKNHYCDRPEGCPEHILLHCVDGSGIVGVDHREYILEANEFILIPANTPHFYHANYTMPWTIYWMHFHGSHTALIIAEIYKKVQKEHNKLAFDGELVQIFNRYCRLLQRGYSKEILNYISMSLPNFFSGYLFPELFKNIETTDTDVVDISIAFLQQNIGNRLGLKEIADNVHLSVSHFSKLFKNRTGYSPIEYLNHLKIQKACYLLQFSEKRVSIISYELGFEDQYYFSRLFKEHMGVSPTHYRDSLKTDNKKVH
ncbi:AraC family transcriptional regulator [Sphingobacterium sp. HMA12]|uniref:helix-turn-helix domain-containing protein n=1 Tax=Sphingobacterium sp. HMA12 TaxID=2050894 RepID=UPI000CEA2C23|nr:AraC family transcriptional regulator [Sphingobacterium sp. HMA12]